MEDSIEATAVYLTSSNDTNMKDPKVWRQPDRDEFQGLVDTETIEIVKTAPRHATIIPSMIDRKVKPDKLKSRILAIGTTTHDKRPCLKT